MRILTALTYFRPHYSGLTIYAERLAHALVKRGHSVTVLTSQYDPRLPLQENHAGIQVIRLPVRMRVSKGVIMPQMPLQALRLITQADLIHLHVPQLDAAPLAITGWMLGKPVVLTYHCDLKLPQGIVHQLANWVSNLANHVAARFAQVVITNTRDYAENSPFLRQYLSKLEVIPPPVDLVPAGPQAVAAFRQKFKLHAGEPIIGMAARFATEKGVEFLVQALPEILVRHPKARVLFVGQFRDVLGEEAYFARLTPLISKLGSHWEFLGVLPPEEFTAFFHVVDVLVLPSINSTESYGMVQVEAMTCGTPVVASDLPGVRQPVNSNGMGIVVPLADPGAIAQAVNEILSTPEKYRGNPAIVAERNSPETVAVEYERVFMELAKAVNPVRGTTTSEKHS